MRFTDNSEVKTADFPPGPVGVPDHAHIRLPDVMVGNPARQAGWMSRHGHRLRDPDSSGTMICPESGYRYREVEPGILRCIDLDENAPLPQRLTIGSKTYDELKTHSSLESEAVR